MLSEKQITRTRTGCRKRKYGPSQLGEYGNEKLIFKEDRKAENEVRVGLLIFDGDENEYMDCNTRCGGTKELSMFMNQLSRCYP